MALSAESLASPGRLGCVLDDNVFRRFDAGRLHLASSLGRQWADFKIGKSFVPDVSIDPAEIRRKFGVLIVKVGTELITAPSCWTAIDS